MRIFSRRKGFRRSSGFTLVEILVATAVMTVVLILLLQVIGSMTSLWRSSTGTISNFQAARGAFTAINQSLARATLMSYFDYINDPALNNSPFGQFRSSLTPSQQQTFTPYGFTRASELHFLCGPAAQLLPGGATVAANPGDAVFFQAPLGRVGGAGASDDKYLRSALNDVGFYIQYGDLGSNAFPGWLTNLLGASPHYRFRLVQCVEATENLSVYRQTSGGSYSLGWLPPVSPSSFPPDGASYNESLLAENVVLLLFRPRVEAQDERVVAGKLGGGYSPAVQNAVVSPNYAYDSRAWQPGYSFSTTSVQDKPRAVFMRNQLPPIVDVAMVCVDPNSLARIHIDTQATPPAMLQPAAGLFANSANLDTDLASFGQQLSANHIRYRIFRSSVKIQAAAWADE